MFKMRLGVPKRLLGTFPWQEPPTTAQKEAAFFSPKQLWLKAWWSVRSKRLGDLAGIARIVGIAGVLAYLTYINSEPAQRKARIHAFKTNLLKKQTLNQSPSQSLPRLEGLFPEYEAAFRELDQILIVDGPSGIGKTIKTIEMLRDYEGPVFFKTFLHGQGDATQVICGFVICFFP